MKKYLIFGVVLLFLNSSISVMAQSKENSHSISSGDWLYVGGFGPGNYTRIQDALNASSDGDTVFVFSGRYFERIFINASVHLLGEDAVSTIIDGSNVVQNKGLVNILSDGVLIDGFTLEKGFTGIWIPGQENVTVSNVRIQESPNDGITVRDSSDVSIVRSLLFGHYMFAAVSVYDSENILIADNNFTEDFNGVYLTGVASCVIQNNTIQSIFQNGVFACENVQRSSVRNNVIQGCSCDGIQFCNSSGNSIENNTLQWNGNGIHLCVESTNNSIQANILRENKDHGILIHLSSGNRISNNRIQDNHGTGLFLEDSSNTLVIENRFEGNAPNALFEFSAAVSFQDLFTNMVLSRTNLFRGNYWDRPRVLPMTVKGVIILYPEDTWQPPFNFHWFICDNTPARSTPDHYL